MEKNENTRIYEVGFLLNPTLGDDSVPAVMGELRSFFEKNGGLLVSEDFPKMRNLAYAIAKKIGAKKTVYDHAFFGWVKYELSPDKLEIVKRSLDNDERIIRYLLITTVRESTLAPLHKIAPKPEGEPVKEKKEGIPPKPEISQEEIDKTIDELVIE